METSTKLWREHKLRECSRDSEVEEKLAYGFLRNRKNTGEDANMGKNMKHRKEEKYLFVLFAFSFA